jgi:hypothetical protein
MAKMKITSMKTSTKLPMSDRDINTTYAMVIVMKVMMVMIVMTVMIVMVVMVMIMVMVMVMVIVIETVVAYLHQGS